MSMTDYQKACEVIEKNRSKCFFAGPRPESLVKSAENALSLDFPPTYRKFVLDFGAGNVGSIDIFGVTTENFSRSTVPNGIWYNLKERDENLPNHLLIISDTGDGDYYCLDFSQTNESGECPVVLYISGYPLIEQPKEKLFNDFGEFLWDITSYL